MKIDTPYTILGVPTDADEETIKQAYRQKARESHPDRGGDSSRFDLVKRAYDTLSNPEARKEYDETGVFAEKKIDNKHADMVAFLVVVFEKVVAATLANGKKPKNVAILDNMKRQVKEAESAFTHDEKQLGKAIADLEDVRDRTTDEEGVLLSVISHQIEERKKVLKALLEKKEVVTTALAYLNSCQYKFEEPTTERGGLTGGGIWVAET